MKFGGLRIPRAGERERERERQRETERERERERRRERQHAVRFRHFRKFTCFYLSDEDRVTNPAMDASIPKHPNCIVLGRLDRQDVPEPSSIPDDL